MTGTAGFRNGTENAGGRYESADPSDNVPVYLRDEYVT